MIASWWPAEFGADPVIPLGVAVRMAVAVFVGAVPLAGLVPVPARAALALALAAVSLPAAGAARWATAPSAPAAPLPLVIGGEAVVGLGLGLIMATVVAAAAWAGMLLGSATGLTWADDFATEGDLEAAGMTRLARWLGVAGFIGGGGHLAVVGGLLDSVQRLPVGMATAALATGDRGSAFIDSVTAAPAVGVSLALALAAPALAAVVTFHVAAAVCLRTVRFVPGPGLLQAAAALVLVATLVAGAEFWLGGFGAVAQARLDGLLFVAPGR